MPTFDGNCAWTQDRVELYLDGELKSSEFEAFEQHVETCSSCREELSAAKNVLDGLRALPQQYCPERVVDRAAGRIGAGSSGTADTFLQLLRNLIGGRGLFAMRPAPAVMILIVVAASVFLLSRHERAPSTRAHEPFVTTEYTEKELEIAKLDAMVAFAYLGKYSRRTGEIIVHDVIDDRVMTPIHKTVVEPMNPFLDNG